jgi:hypothetical protein
MVRSVVPRTKLCLIVDLHWPQYNRDAAARPVAGSQHAMNSFAFLILFISGATASTSHKKMQPSSLDKKR